MERVKERRDREDDVCVYVCEGWWLAREGERLRKCVTER